jgi:phage terminase large subunit
VTGAAQNNFRRWRENPISFVREQFGVEPDLWQQDALMAFADPKVPRISLQACAGPGKSAVLAWCGWNILSCYARPGEHPKGAATSITADNLKDNLWAEFAKWHHRSPFLLQAFEWTKERIFAKQHPQTWFLAARSWPKTASAEEQGKTLSGLHSRFPFALLDESGAIPATVLRAAEQALSNCEVGKIVQAGNPISTDGMLYAAASQLAHQWRVIRVTGDPDDPKRSARVDLAWAKEQLRIYGRENPWVMSYILGQFPQQQLGKLLSLADLEAAQERKEEEDPDQPLVIGVDVGVTGTSIIYARRGRLLYEPKVLRGCSSIVIAAEVVTMAREVGSTVVFIDAGGPGMGVVDQCRALGLNVVPVYFGAGADEPTRYANKRIEMYVRCATWVKEGGAIHRCPELVQDLLEPEVTWNLKGQQILEPKEWVKERLGRWPDWGDAFALTFAYPVAPPVPTDDGDRRAVAKTQRRQSHNEFARGGAVESHNEFGRGNDRDRGY